MDFITGLQASLVALFAPFFDIIDQRNVYSYLGALFFMFVMVCAMRLTRRRKDFRWRALGRLVFRRSVWLHPSSLLDYKLYVINVALLTFALGYLIIGSNVFADLTTSGLTALFGPPATSVTTNGWIVAAVVIVLLLSFDLGYWIGHLAMHKSKTLWEFHKVHHSAAVLTPATEFRQHPVELVVVPTAMAVTTGIGFGLVTHWFGTGAPALGRVGFNLIILVHVFTIHHLRHSHFNIPFTGIWGWLVHSPGHHRIHHSDNPLHFDRNMGYMLSIWDALAGTLHRPRPNEPVTLGIGPEGALHTGIGVMMWMPIRNCWRLWTRRGNGGLETPASHARS